MKELLLVTATAMEMRAVLGGLAPGGPVPDQGETALVDLGGRRVRLMVTGVGPVAAAFAVGRASGQGLLAGGQCVGMLNLGIAGTYVPDTAALGSVVVADAEVWPEYGLVTDGKTDARALGFPLAGKRDDTSPPPVWETLDLSASACAAMGLRDPLCLPRLPENPAIILGRAITVAGVSGTRGRAKELAARYGALMENMEGFPLALAGRGATLPFAEIRAVSNIVGDRSAQAWNIPAALAALSRVAVHLFS